MTGKSKMAALRFGVFAAAIAFIAAASPASAGQFDGVTLRLGTFGGKWRDIVDAHVAKAFAAEGGKIEYVLGQPANNMAKLIAARGQEAPFDVLEVLDNLLPSLTAGGFLAPIDLAKIPNAKNLAPSMADSSKVMIWITQEGIIYNKKIFAEQGIPVPASYGDLANPKLKGKVSLPDISAGGAMPAIVGMTREADGTEANIDPGLEIVRKIAPANFWSSSANLQTLLANGDVWAAAAQAGNVQRLRGQVDLGIVFPKVGGKNGVLKQGYLVKIAGTRHSAAVDWLINAFLADAMQKATLDEGGQVPVSKPVLELLSRDPQYGFLRLKPDELAQMYEIDFSKVDEAAYVQRWNRRITR